MTNSMLFTAAQDAIILTDRDGVVTAWNSAAERIFGYSAADVVGRPVADVIVPTRRRRAFVAQLRRYVARRDLTRLPSREQVAGVRSDNEPLQLELTIATHGDDGVDGFIVFARDITPRVDAQRRERESEARYQSLIEQIPAVTYVQLLTDRRPPLFFSPQVEALLGYTSEELLEQPDLWFDLVHPDDRARVAGEIERTNATGEPFSVEFRMRARDQRLIWVKSDAVLLPTRDAEDGAWHGIMVDITERKFLEERLSSVALRDQATNLPTHALLIDRIRHALDQAARAQCSVAILCVDLSPNDRRAPHELPIPLLVGAAERLQAMLRAGDSVSRTGDAEFSILLHQVRDENVPLDVARRVLRAAKLPFFAAGGQVQLPVRIGIGLSSARQEADRAADLLALARSSVLRAPEGGIASAELDVDQPALGTIGGDRALRQALDRDEFVLHYEPISSLITGELVGVEAHARWRHPELGLLGPSEYVRYARDTDTRSAISRWVVRSACGQLADWRRKHGSASSLHVHVNLSSVDLEQHDLSDFIEGTLRQTGLPPGLLVVECSEAALTRRSTVPMANLRSLDKLGLKLLVENFGSGFTTLHHLRNTPLDYVKISADLVADLGIDLANTLIVSGIVGVAHALGIEVIADRVSTLNQLQYLNDLRCDLGQGHLFSSALRANQVGDLLDRGDLSDVAKSALPTRLRAGGGAESTIERRLRDIEAMIVSVSATSEALLDRLNVLGGLAAAPLGAEAGRGTEGE